MKLIILAAGFSTRLEPRTLKIPKQLLPIGESKLIDLLFNTYKEVIKKFSEIIIITNEKYFSQFSKWEKHASYNVQVISDGVKSKEMKLGAVGDLLYAIKNRKIDEDIFVCGGSDFVLSEIDYSKVIAFFNDTINSVLLVRPEKDLQILKSGSCVEIDENKLVKRFEEKPDTPFSKLYGLPYYLIKKNDLKLIKNISQDKYDNSGQIAAELAKSKRLVGFEYQGSIIHLTTEKDYQELIANQN